MTASVDTGDSAVALSVQGLSHAFKGRVALSDVTFDVAAGTIHGFVGPNGAGKTTTLKAVSTLLAPQAGKILVFGDDVARQTFKVRRAMGYMPDHFGMYRQMTVFEYLDFFAAAYGQSIVERDKTVKDVLQLTDMDGRQKDLIRTLSRGMQQRVSLARVLVHDPRLLLLDEPASGLDPRARIELMEILRELSRMGKTVLISSHILSELATLCDDVTIIDRGRVKYTGSMDGLLQHAGGSLSYRIECEAASQEARAAIARLPGVVEVTEEPDGHTMLVQVNEGQVTPNTLLRTAIDAGVEVRSFGQGRRQLDEAFLDLTEPGVDA